MRRGLVAAVLLASTWQGSQPAPRSSGVDRSGFSATVRPQDDLFEYVNGRWLQTTEIPQERVSFGTFTELQDRVTLDLRAIVEEVARQPDRRSGSIAQQIGDLYTSMFDEEQVERQGAAPLAPVVARIERIRSPREMAEVAGFLSSLAAGGPFAGEVGTHPQDPARFIVHVTQGGILLPDREYYAGSEGKFPEIRREYVAFLTRIFSLAGRAHAGRDAEAVLALEIELARAHRVASDPGPAEVPKAFTLDQLVREMPGFDWRAWGAPQGMTPDGTVVLRQPSFFRRFAALVQSTPIDTWKAWLAGRYITAVTPYASRAFNQARFDFFGRLLTGQEAPIVRWKRAVSVVNNYLGDAIGRAYVERHFSPAAKTRVEAIVANLRKGMQAGIENADWMTPETRRRAASKLSQLKTRVGHPERWRSYRGLEIRADDLLGNIQRAQQFDNRWRMTRVGARGDDGYWLMTPQTLNAYYAPGLNEIVVPAAMLQPPLFDEAADDAVNYGSIGAVLGHELSHAFDASGRQYDGSGDLRDWWTAQDLSAFAGRVETLIAHYAAFSAAPGVPVNGELTLVENIGDLSGLAVAYRAYRLSLEGRAAPVIDGLTGDERFFMGWARVWRGRERPDYLRQTLHTNRHAPWRFRANGPASHLDAFHEAFGVKSGDRLYLEPAKRVRLW